jgi:membrane protein
MGAMKQIDKLVVRVNHLQQRNGWLGFVYAVIKKYGEDDAGHRAALLTYYSFLSLFPLLLIVTTIASTIGRDHPDAQNTIINSVTSYFPVLGDQLSNHIHTLHKSGWALIFGLLVTFYGARGVADVFRGGVNAIWRIPKDKQDGFPKSLFKSFGLIIVGGLGLITASVLAGMAAAAGRGLDFRLLAIAVNLFVLFWVFVFLLNFCLPKHVSAKEVRPGAAVAAIGLVLLQSLGGYILTRELKNLDALYSYFAVSLGLLFWIYLQAQVLYYAVEIASVKSLKLWPRSLNKELTPADTRSNNLR